MMAWSTAFLFLLVVAPAAANKLDVTPLQKVTQMLQDMVAKGKEEKHTESVEFAKMSQWCTSTRTETERNIADEKAQIEQLSADAIKAGADAETLAEEIKELEAETAKYTGELDDAKAEREQEKSAIAKELADIQEAISAVEIQIQEIKQNTGDIETASAVLVQLKNAKRIPDSAKDLVTSYLDVAQGAGSDEVAPEAKAFEGHGGGIVEVFENLLTKFKEQKLDLEKKEMTSHGNFQVVEQQLTDNIRENSKRTGEKTKMKAQRKEDEETALGDKESTETALATDEKILTDTNSECSAASDEFEKNQVMRAEEIKAIETAVGILSSDAVAGNADKHLPASLIQVSATALVQLRSSAKDEPALAVRSHVAEFLQAKAKKLQSGYLALIASKAAADPFVKIKKMIKDMIVKLMEEANSEADKKAYCDTEMATNKMTRDNKQSEVDELTAAVEEHTALSAKLSTEIKELSDAIAAIKEKQVSYTTLRNEEKEVNKVAIEDAKVAAAAVEKATKVLKDFYAKAAEGGAASMLQSGAGLRQEMAQAAKEPYTGMQAASGGVMGFLEVVLSDFVRLQTETEEAESMAQTDYEKFMDESTEDAEVKGVELEHKEKKKIATEEANRALKKELDLTQTELNDALAYFEKLKPDCIDEGISYEEKVAMRKEEIVSLQEALKILSGEDIA
eukprot:gnl/TRDRNA2_/TRDRNA2_176853_c3_seq10.p1 gnl/TRDRNA2_/TRDRNA2_176853_c3~~gnl/TRDRNA2_/TRDRNA2_176853_c3_seq10.p1  ORF type:complete len:680 (+),score=267.24 gnl/TRDRNA2_/TRDRNA2_176853_c3_seq10:70-2109(+)